MIAPPMPRTPPRKPAANPRNCARLKNFSDILSYSFLNTNPKLYL
jgi:hypothetical protein